MQLTTDILDSSTRFSSSVVSRSDSGDKSSPSDVIGEKVGATADSELVSDSCSELESELEVELTSF